jgi:hypothetical protein
MREEKCGWPLNPHCTTLVIQVAQISLSKTRGPWNEFFDSVGKWCWRRENHKLPLRGE